MYWAFKNCKILFHRFAERFIFFMCGENKLFFALSAGQTLKKSRTDGQLRASQLEDQLSGIVVKITGLLFAWS